MMQVSLLVSVLLLYPTIALDNEEEIVDLYGKDDAVVHMDYTNFEELLYGKSYIWAVEFYNSWCGHCQLYAPTWLKLAQQTAKWNRVVRVSAINCARAENLPLCRNYDIGGYPWIKFFRPLTKKDDHGEMQKHESIDAMLDKIVDFATGVQKKTHPPLWPNLAPFEGPLTELLHSPEPVHALVLEESAESRVGRLIMLALSDQPRLRLVRVLQPPAGLQLTETARPLLVTWRRGSRQLITSQDGLPTRRVFGNSLRALLGLSAEREPAAAVASPDLIGARPAPAVGDGVHMVDLENAVSYALKHEVAGRKSISGEQLAALRAFLQLLVDHLPGRQSVVGAVRGVLAMLEGRQQVTGAEIQTHLETAQLQLPAHQPWRGCRGSDPRYRGYPCSLWSLFHTLTLHASQNGPDKVSVLPAIHGYVKHFFSCAHCSQHFQEMADKEGLFNVTLAGEASLWLWRAHNLVNKRLAGDATEDPKHPKLQFPSKKQCLACFDQKEMYAPPIVLAFLGSFYGQAVIQLDGLTDASAAQTPSLVGPRVQEAARRLSQTAWSRHVSLVPITTGDISLCVMLWTFSFVTLLLALFLFRVKRRYKRKTSKAFSLSA